MKSAPARSACAPDWCETLLTSWYIVFTRACGLAESVPNEATPAMLTAGPIGSLGSACNALRVTCTRVSFTVIGESVSVLLTAID